MLKRLLNTLAFFLLVSSSLRGQEIDFVKYKGEPFKAGLNASIDGSYFHQYGFPKMSQFVTLYPSEVYEFNGLPEEVLYKIYTAVSEDELPNRYVERLDFNLSEYKIVFDIPLADSVKKSTDFIILNHKFTFKRGREDFSIIKYTQYVDSLSVGTFSVQFKQNIERNHWVVVKLMELQEIENVILNVTAPQFWSLVKSSSLDENDYQISQEILDRVKDSDRRLNFYKLNQYLEGGGSL